MPQSKLSSSAPLIFILLSRTPRQLFASCTTRISGTGRRFLLLLFISSYSFPFQPPSIPLILFFTFIFSALLHWRWGYESIPGENKGTKEQIRPRRYNCFSLGKDSYLFRIIGLFFSGHNGIIRWSFFRDFFLLF